MAITKAKKEEIVKRAQGFSRRCRFGCVREFPRASHWRHDSVAPKTHARESGLHGGEEDIDAARASGMKVEGEMPELLGEVAVAYGADKIVPAREIYEFKRRTKSKSLFWGASLMGRIRIRRR